MQTDCFNASVALVDSSAAGPGRLAQWGSSWT